MLRKTLFDPRTAQLSDGTLLSLGVSIQDYGILAAATALLFAVSVAQERGIGVRAWMARQKTAVRWVLLYGLIVLILAAAVTAPGVPDAFMYAIF